jgi:hypothetical protein
MFYAWDITITANTLEDDPKTQILKLTKGTITGIDVKFPPGCHGLVKVRILRSEFQLIPLSRDEWVTGDGEPVVTEGFYVLEETPTELKFVACSPGSSYDHTVTVRISVVPEEIASPWQTLSEFAARLKSLMGI